MKNKLKEKKFTVGGWITIGSPIIAEIFSRAGFDWVVVDLEHSVTGLEMAGDLIRTIDLCGGTPLVRLTSYSPDQIKRVMDAGAHGIIVPNVNTKETAIQAVAATRYPPLGFRGVGLGRAQGFGVKFAEYFEWQKTEPIVIAMIEHKDAVLNIDEILDVPGLDGFLVGPYDLSASLGVPGDFENPIFLRALNLILESGLRKKCIVGIHIVEPDLKQLEETKLKGYNFIAYGVDIRMLDISARAGINKTKE
jgi:2-keto-3-deoxy-L-rhamnonate aldolase RhmA